MSAVISPVWTERGTPAYRRITLALFLAGFATFAQLYCVQPLLPVFSDNFGISPTTSSLAVSVSTLLLAFSILCTGSLSESWGRKGLMTASLLTAGTLTLAVSAAPTWDMLLLFRGLGGLALGGAPAVAMAYLAEETHPGGLGFAMGLYVGGTAFGGMAGRVITGFLAESYGWRVAVGSVGVLCLLAAVAFASLLPASRNFVRQSGRGLSTQVAAWGRHGRNPTLARLFVIGFLAMASFVTVYNYAGFRLTAPPYNLDQAEIGLIFTVYLFGVGASAATGSVVNRLGQARTLQWSVLTTAAGVAVTLLHSLPWIIAGIVLVTIGFFGMHATASGWVGRKAKEAKGQAAALYLLSYYLGSSVMGSAGGWFWTRFGWDGITAYVGILLATALLVARQLATPPSESAA